ncbi:hypothetical protein NDU88_005075 [Pleurodeles waltl]|uniref:Uncharacterized protein n=1 Tax=Pleurodeles waltl TaxID=8319 RepID=A0AAV7T9Y5_PLEWA|nr:hypothetical protein NDU88_005075 [Pleurodeles waltl]
MARGARVPASLSEAGTVPCIVSRRKRFLCQLQAEGIVQGHPTVSERYWQELSTGRAGSDGGGGKRRAKQSPPKSNQEQQKAHLHSDLRPKRHGSCLQQTCDQGGSTLPVNLSVETTLCDWPAVLHGSAAPG